MRSFWRWPQKKHRPTELFTPFEALYKTGRDVPKVGQISATLRTKCAHGGPRFQIDVPKAGLIFKFQTRGLETCMTITVSIGVLAHPLD